MQSRFLLVAPSPRHNPPARLSSPRLGYQTVWGAAVGDRLWLRGAFPTDLTVKRVDKHLCDIRLVRSGRRQQRLSQRRVFIEHTRAVMALPPALIRLNRPEEPTPSLRAQAVQGRGSLDERNRS
jgi:hypothetical protein